MAKLSSIKNNNKRREMVSQFSARRLSLNTVIHDRNLPIEERFQASLKLAEMPRNSSKIRIRNRCEITGRARAYYRKFKISRIALRDLASLGLIPGMTKASW